MQRQTGCSFLFTYI